MNSLKEKFEALKNRFSSYADKFKSLPQQKQALIVAASLLLFVLLLILAILFRKVIGNIILGIGVILFIVGIIYGIKTKEVFIAVVIVLVSILPIALGNAILPKDQTPETTTEEFVRSLPDATDPETTTEEPTTEAPTTTEPETTEAPTTTEPETEPPTQEQHDYVVNTNTRVFHRPGCSSVSKMKSKNRSDRTCTRDELIAAGYKPCAICNP